MINLYKLNVEKKMEEYLQYGPTLYDEGTLWTLYGLLNTNLISKKTVLNWLQKFNFGNLLNNLIFYLFI